jgi:hypothetical protein
MSKHERIHRPVEDQALGRVQRYQDRNHTGLDQSLDLVPYQQILMEVKRKYTQLLTNNEDRVSFYTDGFLTEGQQKQLIDRIAQKYQIYNVYFIPLTESGEKITLISIHRN